MTSNIKATKFLDIFAYASLFLSVILVPLFLDKNLINFYIIPKQYVIGGFVLLALLFWLAKFIINKKMEIRKTIIDIPILVALSASLLSAIFSVNKYDSFFGRSEYFAFNFLFLIFCVLTYYLAVYLIDTTKRWYLLYDAMVGIGGVVAFLFVLKSYFNVDPVAKFLAPVWNTVDSVNSVFGIFCVVIFILSAGQLIRKKTSLIRSIIMGVVSLLCFLVFLALGFKLVWWMVLLSLVFLILLGVTFVKEARFAWVSGMFALLILTIVFLVTGSPKKFQVAVPAEVALGLKPSWEISYKTVLSGVKPFVLGSGVGTFGVDFSRFRSTEFNLDPVAWSLRFNQPVNSALSVLAEGGLVLSFSFIFLMLLFVGYVFHAWFKEKNNRADSGMNFDTYLVSGAIIVVAVGTLFVFYGQVIWWLWWLLLGIAVTGLSSFNTGVIKTNEWKIDDTPQYNLSFSFGVIVVMAAVVLLSVWGFQQYQAEAAYARAFASSDYNVAEREINDALSKRGSSDLYHAALAQIYLLRAIDMSKQNTPDVQAISGLVAKAVNEARSATDISPKSVALWENLATMYENASVLVPEARDWSIKTLTVARDLEPTNPVLWWRLGNNYSSGQKWEDATKSYNKALELKPEYVGAYVGLANAYEQQQNMDKALQTYEKVLAANKDNPEIMYNYGRLLYNRNSKGDRDKALEVWKQVLKVQPNYSNALYSVGLLYELRGDKNTALQYYYKVKDLNPNNPDIINKIKNIAGGAK